MKILIISFSVNGSLGEYFKQTSRSLAKNNELYVLSNRNISSIDCGTENIYNVYFNREKPFTFVNPISYYKIWKYIQKNKFDIAFICSPNPVNIFLYFIIQKKKICTYIHDHKMHSGLRKLYGTILTILLRISYLRSNKIITSYYGMKKEILALDIIEEKNINVVYMPNIESLSYPSININDSIDVLFFGRIELYKGLDTLVNAAKELPNVQFVIAGKGDVCGIFRLKELPSNVHHLNYYIQDYELAELIASSKIIVFPYRDATGTQTVPSAYFYSKPVIATSVGCFPEYVVNNKTGLLVPPNNPLQLADAIHILINNKELRRQMGIACKSKVQSDFCDDKLAQQYLEIFYLMMK